MTKNGAEVFLLMFWYSLHKPVTLRRYKSEDSEIIHLFDHI